VLTSTPSTDGPTQKESWNSGFSHHDDLQQLMCALQKVMHDIVPEELQDTFQSSWADFLKVDLQHQSLEVTEEHCWRPAGAFVPAFHEVSAAAAAAHAADADGSSSTDASSGILVEPVTHSGYVFSQKARAALAKDRRKQHRTNMCLEPGMLLAVAKVSVRAQQAPRLVIFMLATGQRRQLANIVWIVQV
jgi:hypothetical protein